MKKEDDGKEDSIDVGRVVMPKEAEKAIETLRIFLESQENIYQDCFSTVLKLQKNCQSKKNFASKTPNGLLFVRYVNKTKSTSNFQSFVLCKEFF